MSSHTLVAEAPRLRVPSRFTPRLLNAELLKLRKRRGLLATVAIMTLGASIVTYGVLAVLHAVNPAHHGPAGGINNFGHVMFVLGTLGSVAATIVGATAGAGDLNAGVFRELVVTGRSRRTLFGVRIPGGLVFLLPFVVVAFTLAAVASVVFADSLAAPRPACLQARGPGSCSRSRSTTWSRSAWHRLWAPAR